MFPRCKSFLQNNLLFIIVFITGGIVLVLEITATRILSPFFGSTIYTVSSVFSLILFALSVGYYTGGRLADKKPSLGLFYAIIALSGAILFYIYIIQIFLLPVITSLFSVVEGPFISAVFLFFAPSMLLGMLSPVVTTLQKVRRRSEGIGKITGDVFFWSTLGSIAGSVGAGFVLIPFIGVDRIMIGAGIILSLIGITGLLSTRMANSLFFRNYLLLDIAGCFFAIYLLVFLPVTVKQNVVFTKDGVYEKLLIFDGVFNNKPARFFQQDRTSSGAMFIDSDELVYDYTKYYQLYKIMYPGMKNTLVIGGGAYTIPKALLSVNQNIKVDVSEIEPSLYDISEKYFRVPADPRLQNYIEDGRRFLYDTGEKYDLIFNDSYYSLYSVPIHFTTKEFFELSKSKLSNNGIYLANIIGSISHSTPSFIFSEIKTFKSVFPNSYIFAITSPEYTGLQNFILVGYNSNKRIDFQSLKNSKDTFLSSLHTKQIDIDRIDLSEHVVFTDDYAPVEFYISKALRQ